MFKKKSLFDFFSKSEQLSQNLPSLLSESSILSRNILEGLHSTRFAGKGESFWQFREYLQGDVVTNIDWRKSASTKKILIKEKEKEIYKDIYIYYDKSKSMHYASQKDFKSKLYISILLSLTLCKLFARNREKVYLFNSKDIPINCSNNINNFNEDYFLERKNILPNSSLLKQNSLFILFSDFLYDTKELSMFINKLKSKNIIGYLIQVFDPMELTCNFKGYNKLIDMETGDALILGNDDSFLKSYKKRIYQLKESLFQLSNLNNWNFISYSTNDKASDIMLDLTKKIILNKRKN